MVARRAIVIGASSGIGKAIAVHLDRDGYSLGLVARREDLLRNVAAKLCNPVFVKPFDISQLDSASRALTELIKDMGDVDLVVFAAGVGFDNPNLDWKPEEQTIAVNVVGFTQLITMIARYFEQRGRGHITAISSIAAIRGHGDAPAYGASKAFASNYLFSLRQRFQKKGLPICVTEIQPGFVNTSMAKSSKLFWVAPVEKAGRQICKAIYKRRDHAYVTKRWSLVAWLLRAFPNALYNRI